MSSKDPGSITRLLGGLKAGLPEAVGALWQRYEERLKRLARRRLNVAHVPDRAVEDEDDVALIAFHCLCSGAAKERFARLNNREDLWRLLGGITAKVVLSRRQWYTRQKRDARNHVLDEAALSVANHALDPKLLSMVPGTELTPEGWSMLLEAFQALLEALEEPPLQQVALWRMDGLSNAEIAVRLECAVRTVERKLERIRFIWQQSVAQQQDEPERERRCWSGPANGG